IYQKRIQYNVRGEDAVDFDQAELGFTHHLNFGVSGRLDFKMQGETLLNREQVYFMDYKHFGGNRTLFSNMGAASNYRFLEYYQFSSTCRYFSGIFHYQFRKFLATQLPMLRFSGVRENVFLNYLTTEHSPHYVELGYSLDNLFRIF